MINSLEEFIKDRNEAFTSKDVNKIIAYCKKYNVTIPDDEETFWIGVHKAVCNLYQMENSAITKEQYKESYDWLVARGYSASID